MNTDTPDWLLPKNTLQGAYSDEARLEHVMELAKLSNMEISFSNFFEHALEDIAGGRPLSRVVSDDPRGFSYSKFLNWIHADEERKKRYYAAQAIGADAIADEVLSIADAENNPLEDVQRSTLRINTRKFLLGVWNRKRYGEVKQIDSTVSFSLLEAIQKGEQRIANNREPLVIEGERIG